MVALDVAAGTGHAARGLAPQVASVVALDATVAMLTAGRDAAAAAGLRNVAFMRGDAAALPFLDETFDVVVCRFAVHHFPSPEEPLAEMLRCLRPHGQLLVADLVADPDPSVAATQNALEVLRDPSHTRCWSADDLRRRVEALGMADVVVDHDATVRPLAPWLAQTNASPAVVEAVTRALQDELAGGSVTGLRPQLRDGDLWFEQRFAAVTGRRPA